MINSVLKMVLKWKQHFFKVNCNNCRVHLFWGFGFFSGAGTHRNIVSDRPVSKPNVKGQNKLGGG